MEIVNLRQENNNRGASGSLSLSEKEEKMLEFFTKFRVYFQKHRELKDLERLSDLELKDMGINRQELYYRIMHHRS